MNAEMLQEEALSICNALGSKEITEDTARLKMGALVYEASGIIEALIYSRHPETRGGNCDISETVDDISIQLFEKIQRSGERETFRFDECARARKPFTGWIGVYAEYAVREILRKECRNAARNADYAASDSKEHFSLYKEDDLDDELVTLVEEQRNSQHCSGLLLFQMYGLPLPQGTLGKNRSIERKLRKDLKYDPKFAISLLSQPPKCLSRSLRDWSKEHYAAIAELDVLVQAGMLITALSPPSQIELAKKRLKQLASERG